MLREYQIEAIQSLRLVVGNGAKSPLLVAPTGSGKTACAADLIRRAREKAQQVLFLAPRRELVYQVEERLRAMEMEYGLIMAGEDASLMPPIQVASIATLHERAIRSDKIWMPSAGLVLLDEAHEGTFGRAKDILDYYRERGSVIVGLTATPARPSDGRGLGEIYDTMVQGPTPRELIEQGYLVAPRHFEGEAPNLDGVKVNGDYVAKQLDERVREPKLIGAVVANWLRLASDRQTFVFAHNVAHSRDLCEQFRSRGVAAEHLDGNTPLDERKEIHDRLVSGETQVLVNCEVYTYGVDFPPVSCIVLARPTKSIVRYLQTAGRGLRIYPGKSDCLILDHGLCRRDCGFVDDDQPWTLDGKKKIQDERKIKARKEPKEIACGQCGCVFPAKPNCPNCGEPMSVAYRKAVQELQAELSEVDRKAKKANGRKWSMGEKRRFFGELRGVARQRGYKDGWAVHAYQERIGALPWPVYDEPAREPSKETLAWCKHLQIKRAKAREKAA